MKRLPKNRAIVYVVLRTHMDGAFAVLDSFATAQACEDKCGEYAQQMLEAGAQGFIFVPCLSYFYDM